MPQPHQDAVTAMSEYTQLNATLDPYPRDARSDPLGLARLHTLSAPARRARGSIHVHGPTNPAIFQKWILEICLLLETHTVLRFNELCHHLGDISTRTLSRKLMLLQGIGLVQRTFFDTSPPHVEYRLTPQGEAVTAHLKRLSDLLDDLKTGPRPDASA